VARLSFGERCIREHESALFAVFESDDGEFASLYEKHDAVAECVVVHRVSNG
jgi:hypothetical protein